MATKRSGDNENGEEEGGKEFGGAPAEVDDDGSRSIRTILPQELERVEEEHEEQMVKAAKQEEEERRTRRVQLGRPRTPKPIGLGMPHLSEYGNRCFHSPKPPSGYRARCKCSTPPHKAPYQPHKYQVDSLQILVKSQAAAAAIELPPPPQPEPIPPSSESLTQILSN